MELKYINEIESKLNYSFKNKNLMLQAFITPEYAKQHNLKSYEHLKVIGESMISLLFLKCIDGNFGYIDSKTNFYEIKHFQNTEDIYTQKKQMLSDDIISSLFKMYGLNRYINNGNLEIIEDTNKTYVDIMSAIIGATTIDSNFDLDIVEDVFSFLLYLDGEFING